MPAPVPSARKQLIAALGLPPTTTAVQILVEGDAPPEVHVTFTSTDSGAIVAKFLSFDLVGSSSLRPRRVACGWGEVDPESGLAWDTDGQLIPLTRTETGLMRALAQRVDRLCRFRDLVYEVWGIEYVDQRELLRSWMPRIRRKLGDRQPWRYLRTVHGRGYVLVSAAESPS